MRYFNKLLILFCMLIVSLTLTSCKGEKEMKFVQIILTTNEKINLELYEELAPKSVKNFIKLAEEGYYEGAIFHRVIKNFMIQTGGYYIEDNGLLELPETDSIYGEFSSNGWTKNTLKHELGVISMARTSDPDSATSQFFICSDTCNWLDGEYAAFGKTTDEESNDVILRISNLQTTAINYAFQNFPVDIIAIKEVRVSNTKF